MAARASSTDIALPTSVVAALDEPGLFTPPPEATPTSSAPGAQGGTGKGAVTVELQRERSLEVADLELYQELGPSARNVERMQDYHREIARRLAYGERQCDVAKDLGLSPLVISTLVNHSDAFQHTVASYRAIRDNAYETFDAHLKVTAARALGRLHAVIDEEPDLTPEFVRRTTMDLLDRVGHGPVHKTEAKIARLGLSTEDIEDLKREVSEGETTPALPAGEQEPELIP